MTNLGHALAALLQPGEAVEHFQAARYLWCELGSHNIAAEAPAGLADIAFAEGKFDMATAHFEEILAHFAKGGTVDDLASPRNSIGMSRETRGRG